ncbi:MAG: Cof-type HAD-IIB family hydrolase [Lachnospiraceae bacterium]|nr:Cof-type HAD-IIB family hydrolase [Lachnospiraceae bacterium]
MALIFFDIDGTLWDFKNVIPESTKTAIRLLKENGHKLFLSSGRTKVFIRNEELLSMGFDGLLGGCGTEIEYKGEELLCHTIDPEVLARAVKMFDAHDMAVMMESRDVLFLEEDKLSRDDYGKYIVESMRDVTRPVRGNETSEEVCKFTVLIEGREYREVVEALSDDFEVMVHGGFVIEAVPKGYSKASGIAFLCEYLGADKADTYAFGDGANDIEMLDYAGVGIAMGNGTDAAKEHADYITDDIHADGLYNACKHFGLI